MKYYIYLWLVVFKVNFSTGNESTKTCDVVLTESSGFISTPKLQDRSSACWTIKAPVNKVIKLKSIVMEMDYSDLKYDQQCHFSHLTFFNSMYLSQSQIGSLYCNRMEVNIVSSGNYLSVVWNELTKGKTITKRNNFLLQYQFESSQDCPTNYYRCIEGRCLSQAHICDGIFDCSLADTLLHDEASCNVTGQCGEMVPDDENTGLITSHKHFNQSLYPPDLFCQWKIEAPPGKYIRLLSDFFDLFYYNADCSDVIRISDGSIQYGPICGQAGVDLVSNTSVIFMMFITNTAYQGMGFQMRYQFQNHSECGSNYLKCPNNLCVPSSKVCDTFNDCFDGTDEKNCNFDTDFDHPWLLMSNESSLQLKSIQGNNPNISVALYNINVGKGLTMNYGGSSILWTNDDNKTIQFNTVNITNGKVDTLSVKFISDIKVNEVVVDWILGNIYWISEQTIKVSNGKGEYKRSLVSGQTDFPVTLKLDSDRGYMFFGKAGGYSSVVRINMDGDLNSHMFVAYENVYYPGGLALDLQKKHVYWTDPSLGQIHRCNYDGSDRKLILSTIFPQPYRIAVFKDTIYWTTYFSGDMYKCDKDTGENYRKLKTTGVKNLQIFNANLMLADKKKEDEKDMHQCKKDNGGCSHLCLAAPYPANYSCACGDGYMVLKKKECIKDPCSLIPYLNCQCYRSSYFDEVVPSDYFTDIADAIITTEVCGVYSISLDDKYKKVTMRQNNGTNVPGYNDFDPVENVVYWTEGMIDPVIRRSPFGLAGWSQVVVKEKDEIWLCGIGVNWITRMLYWCVFSSQTIKGKSLTGDGKEITVVKSNSPIVAMTIDSFHGHIYWSVWEPEAAIYRSGVNGKRTGVYLKSTSLKEPYSFSVDYMNGRLYWLNKDKIVHRDLDALPSSHGYYMTISSNNLKAPSALDYSGNICYYGTGYKIGAFNRKTHQWTGTFNSPPSLAKGMFAINGIKAVKLKSKDVTPSCPEYARCWGTYGYWECLNASMICDGIPTCFEGIDEIFCERCSSVNCSQGVLKLHCDPLSEPIMDEPGLSGFLNWDSHPFAKFITLKKFVSSECSLYLRYDEQTENENYTRQIETPLASSIHVLRQITKAKIFRNVEIIETLELSGKSLVENIYEDTFAAYKHITNLSISSTKLSFLNEESFWNMSKIIHFNISSNNINFIGETVLHPFEYLALIDMRGNDIKLTSDIFKTNNELKIIYSDSYSFCCIQPKSVQACYAPIYDVSSCTDLIQDPVLRVFLWLVAVFAFVGNIGVLIKRLLIDKRQTGTFNIFVNNLSLSDGLMGFYLLIIAVHDAMFRGHYAWMEYDWRKSTLCKISGMLSLMSSEASVWFIFLITIDRFLAVKYPLGGKRLTKSISRVISFCFWIFAFILAFIPVFPYPEFYSTSGICIALPITSYFQDGLTYSVVLFLGVNFALFCLLGIGQILIFREILMSASKTKRELTPNEKSVAYMLAWVVMTDFFCWIPIGIMVVLALSGVFIPRGVYAWIVVFVLPINSAINPFIYTFAGVIKSKVAKYRSSQGSQNGQSKSNNSTDTQKSDLSKKTSTTSRL